MKVLSDFFKMLWTKKKTTLVLGAVVSLLIVISIRIFGTIECGYLSNLNSINVSLLGIDIAALAILFALLQEKELDQNAKEAFGEQSITFLGNAFFQLIAIILFLFYSAFNSSIIFIFGFWMQIFALICLFDIVIEMFTLNTLVKTKK